MNTKPYQYGCLLVSLVIFGMAPIAADDRDLRKIQDRFMAPCCWQESVAVHRSEIAAQMREEIDRMVAEGKSEDQIVDAYASRYGDRILREPRGNKRIWLTLIPVVLILIAGAWLVWFIRRQRQSPASGSPMVDLPALPDIDMD
jgi:cytochrome c-type biogenesis protein CcmH